MSEDAVTDDKISVITPVYNERDNLPILVESLERVASEIGKTFEIIIVDDNSPDGSWKIAEQLGKKYDNIQIIRRSRKMGLGTAYKEGFEKSSGKIIISIDCDLSHDPDDIPSLLEASKTVDIVIGSRLIKGGEIKGRTIWRDILSVFANWFIKHLTGYQVNDWTSGYRVYHRGVLEKIFPQVACKKWDFQFEVLFKSLKSNFSVKEIPIKFSERRVGRSKFDLDEAFTFAKSVLQIYFRS